MTSTSNRPADGEYWVPRWSSNLFAGDLFRAIPFLDQPIDLFRAEEDGQQKHLVGEVGVGWGLMVSPTCDLIDQRTGQLAHPYRVFVPVLPMSFVIEASPGIARSEGLIRSRDSVKPYMYLPQLPGILEEEHVACLFRPMTVTEQMLRTSPGRVAQFHQQARRHLKVKLAAYWARVDLLPNLDEIPLAERDEEAMAATSAPASIYDDEELGL